MRVSANVGIKLAHNAPLDLNSQLPDLGSLCEVVVANGAKYAMQLGSRLGDGIVVTQVGKTGLQLSLQFVHG